MSDDLATTSSPADHEPGEDLDWYQQHKLALTLAVLPSRRYHRAFEPGCGDGRVSEALAARCDEVVCWDADPAAAASAAARLADAEHVRVAHARLPEDWPDGTADLILLSEIGCFLTPPQLDTVVAACGPRLAPGGVLVAVHRRAPMPLHPGGGDDVHARLFALRGVVRTGGYTDADLRIDVFERPVL